MALSQNQFDVLFALHRLGQQTQRELGETTGLGLGTVNTTVRECSALGYIEQRELTDSGLRALEPYRVDNAVIMAAGLSQRFAPISYEKPKGLLQVHGEVLIEREIRQLQEAGVRDITVVVGYKKEMFFYLANKFEVNIVVNEEYATRNNNSTLWVVRNKLANTYICCSDNYFAETPFESHVYKAYYAAEFSEGETDEWCIETGPGGRITGLEIGGVDSWVMAGHAYFDRRFSENFRRILEEVYARPETASKYWEDIYADHLSELNMVIRKYPEGFINEFDSLDQLQDFDPDFIENVDSRAFDNIVETLETSRSEIKDFYPLKQGITNLSCHFTVGDAEYVYRHPGVGTENMINREAEVAGLSLARDLGLDSTFLDADPSNGWKISRFIPNCRNLDLDDPEELQKAMVMGRELHRSGATMDREFDYLQEGLKYEALLKRFGPIEVPGYFELREKVMRLKQFSDLDGFPTVPSHNDFCDINFLVEEDGSMHLIDWEYAGMSDEGNDFGTFVVQSQLTDEQAESALEYYFGQAPTELERRNFWAHVVFAGWCWYIWSLAKEAEGDNVGEWLYIYYRRAVDNIDELLTEYAVNAQS